MSHDPSEILVSQKYAKRGRYAEVWHRMKRNRGAVFSLILIIVLVLIMIYSFFFISYEQVTAINAQNRFSPPCSQYFFGTDDMGRDVFLRTLYGTQYSFAVGFGSIAFSLVIGVFFGAIAGYYGGWIDEAITRASDVLASIPAILLGMCVITVLGANLINLTLAVGVPVIPGFVRMARASVVSQKSNEYVESAQAIGMSNFRIVFSQVLPNGLSPLIVVTTASIGVSILSASGLSFLGFGIPVPTPEWGAIISSGRTFIRTAPHITFFPGMFILITSLAFNLLGDGLRDALDPKLKK